MQKKLLLLMIFLSMVLPCGIFAAEKHGWFENKVVGEWLVEKGPDRNIRLSINFYYHDPSGKSWPAPKGSVVDGATIPKPLWNIWIGPPFIGNYRRASVVHDVACDFREKICPSSEIAHRMFYDACLCGGVSKIKADVMY
jgi:hypothetical protein